VVGQESLVQLRPNVRSLVMTRSELGAPQIKTRGIQLL